MLTIKLKVNETVAGHLYWFLSKFSKDEIEILEENPEFNKIQNYLTEELRQIDSGSVKLMTVEEAETEIEKTIINMNLNISELLGSNLNNQVD